MDNLLAAMLAGLWALLMFLFALGCLFMMFRDIGNGD